MLLQEYAAVDSSCSKIEVITLRCIFCAAVHTIAHSYPTGRCMYECVYTCVCAHQLKSCSRLSKAVRIALYLLLQVPILYDKQTETIVSNESADIVRMFATECQVTIPLPLLLHLTCQHTQQRL